MKVTKDLFYHLSTIYFYFYSNDSLKEFNSENCKLEAESILKVFGVKFKKEYFKTLSTSYKEYSFNNPFLSKKNKYINNNSIIITELNKLDIESIENILNKEENMFSSILMSPIFDSIGWVLSRTSGKWKIYFKGSYTYDPWKLLNFEKEDLKYELNTFRESINPEEYMWYKDKIWKNNN